MNIKIPTEEEVIKDMVYNAENYAAIYARQSSKKISNSIPSQISKAKELALKNNLLIYKIYAEHISATEYYFKERNKFSQLLLDAKAGLFKNIIVFKRDRLSRRIEDFLEIKKIFKDLGINILYSNEEEFQSNNTPTSDFVENVIMAVSEFEPKNISSRTKEGRKKKREKREYSSKAPFGYEIEKENSIINIESDEDRVASQYKVKTSEASIVKKIFEIFLNNESITTSKEIYNELLKSELPLPRNFNEAKIRSILSNPIYAARQTKALDLKYGNFKLRDKNNVFLPIKPEYFHECTNMDGIIDASTWFSTIDKFLKFHPPKFSPKRNFQSKKYLFKNILYCNKCSHKITLVKNNYTCKTKDCTSIKKEVLVNKLISKILSDLLNEENVNKALTLNDISLKKNLKDRKFALYKNVENQKKLVFKYLNNSNNEETKNSIQNFLIEENNIRRDINNLKIQIQYLNSKFKPIVIPLIKSSYMDLVIKDLLKKKDIVQNLFIENIEKVIIDGKSTTVNIREVRNKS